ncbi:hypothetical protein CBS101457_006514 [Exobasidium rhododendri]|nr:hypothetical protein CBS101457_006514 [Exobasidium rhododendri]
MSSVVTVDDASSERKDSKAAKKTDTSRRRRARSDDKDGEEKSRYESLSGAVARALIGTLAFVFRAPVRLFRPVKLSSWNLLDAMAKREGSSLSLRYMRTLMRREKSTFLPHLLLPPLLVNTTIGFCLFEAYSLTESRLIAKYYPQKETHSASDSLIPTNSATPSFTPLWIVCIAGFSAGAAQCIVSAPLDNVRIILSSQVSKRKGSHHQGSHMKHPLGISWRAVARAALLPFAPELTRSRLVSAVQEGGHTKMSTKDAIDKDTQRLLWEKRIKRWRGGVHGAGLIMSLARDSVGFSAFFVVFEISRRLAFKASLGVDRVLLLFNTSASLPFGGTNRKDAESSDDEASFHLESTGDVSYSQSRTKTGRIVAAFVLICGGAIGAAFYEVVGRPAELMRLVIWEGRKAWEEGRRGTKRDAWSRDRGRMRITGARRREKAILESAGKELRKGSFLALRASNRSGTRLSKIQGDTLQRARRPPHPLKVTANRSRVNASIPHSSRESVHTTATPRHKRRLGLKTKHKAAAPPIVSPPSLETRPSALTLLIEHAERTSILRFTSTKNMLAKQQPTPVPVPVLLFHTYFIAPFSTHPPPILQKSPTLQDASSKTTAEARKPNKIRSVIRNLLHFQYPASNAPGSVKSITQAQVWGSGRVAWAIRRLASPYSIGFLAFAWMSGDLT